MKGLYELLRTARNAPPPSLRPALYAALLRSKRPLPQRTHYITSEGLVLCTSTGLRYAVKEQ